MSKGPLELAWDDNRHNALLARLYKQLHCDPNHVPMSAMDCLAAAMLTLSRGTRQFTQEAVLNYVEKYIMQRDDGLAHVQGGKRFEPAMLITLIDPVLDALRSPEPTAGLDWLNIQR